MSIHTHHRTFRSRYALTGPCLFAAACMAAAGPGADGHQHVDPDLSRQLSEPGQPGGLGRGDLLDRSDGNHQRWGLYLPGAVHRHHRHARAGAATHARNPHLVLAGRELHGVPGIPAVARQQPRVRPADLGHSWAALIHNDGNGNYSFQLTGEL